MTASSRRKVMEISRCHIPMLNSISSPDRVLLEYGSIFSSVNKMVKWL
jgi:hypothetical protein